MNKIYKVIYNKNKHRYEVVSELAKSHGGKCKTTVATAGDTNWLRRLWMRVRGGVNKSDEDGNPVTMSISRAAMVALMCISVWSAAAVSSGASAEWEPVSVKYDKTTGTIKIIKTDPDKNDPNKNVETILATYAVGGSITPIIDNGGTTAKNTIALGQNSTVLQSNTIAIGTDAHAGDVGGSSAQSDGKIAIGNKTVASGDRSIALGNQATTNKGSYNIAQGDDAISIGTSTSVFGYSGVSIGRRNIIGIPDPELVSKDGVLTTKSKTTHSENDPGGNSVIVGAYNVAYGNRSNVIGTYSRAMGSNSVAIGSGVQSLSDGSIAIGKGSGYEFEDGSRFKNGEDVRDDYYGRDWELPPEYKVLKQVLSNDINGDKPYKKSSSGREGYYKYEKGGSLPKYNNYGAGSSDPGGFIVEGKNALGIGTYTQVRGDSAIGLATGEMTADLSEKDKSQYARDMRKIMDMEEVLYKAQEALQAGTGDTAALDRAVKAAEESLAAAKKEFRKNYLSKYSFVEGEGALGVGRQILAQGDRSMAVGDYAKAISSDAIAYGGQTLANGTNSMAMGGKAHVGTEETGFNNSMAIGSHTNVQAGNAVALGAFSEVTGENSLALGFGKQSGDDITYNSVSGKDSTLIGSYGNIAGNNSILIGSSGSIANDRVVGLGNNINIKKADPNDQENNTAGSVFLGDHAGYVKDSKYFRSLDPVNVVDSTEKMKLTESLSSTKGALRGYTEDFIYIYMLERQDDDTQIVEPIAVRSDFAGGDSTVGVVSVGSTYKQKFNNLKDIKEYHSKAGSLITVPVEVTVKVTKNGVSLGEQKQIRYFAADATQDQIKSDSTLSDKDKDNVWNTIQESLKKTDTEYTVFETRRIQNVAPGLIGLNSTDAINGSQLFATNQMLGNLVGSLKNGLGDNVTVTEDGQITVTDGIKTKTLGWIAKAGRVDDSNGTVDYGPDKKTDETEKAYQARIAKLKEDGYIVDASKVMTFKAGKNIGLVQKPGEFSISTIDTPSFKSVELRGKTKEVNGSQETPVTMMDSSGMQVYTETVTPDGSGSTTTRNVSTTVNNEGVTTNGKVVVNNGKTGDEAKEFVTIDKGTDGSGTDKEYGKIGLDGKNGSNATITIDRGTKSLTDTANVGKDREQEIGADNPVAGMDRITYTTKGPNDSTINHEVATLDDGFFLTTSKDVTDKNAPAGVKLNHTIKFTDGANTKVSRVTSDNNGVHSLHIDVTGLPMTYTATKTDAQGNVVGDPVSVSKVGDTYQLADGTKLVKVGDKFYKPSQLVDPKADQPQVRPEEVDKNWTINDSISLVNKDGSNNAPTLKNVGSGLKNAAGNSTSIDQAVGSNAVNVDDLRTIGKAATTEVTGTGAAEVTKVTGADGQNIYNVHVDKLMTVKPVDANTKIARGGDGKYYNADDIAGKIFVPSENKWYNTADIDENTGKPLTGKTPLDNQPIAVDQNKLKNSVVNPNGDGPTVLDNVKSGIGGEVKDAAGNNTFIDNINKVVKKSDDGTAAPDAISENTVVNAKDLKNLVYTGFKLNTSGHSGDAQTVKIGDTIQVVDGKNTTVSAITNPATGVHEFHIDVTGLPVTYTAKEGENGQPVDVSKVGDTYQLAGGTKLVKYGDKFYKPNQIVNGQPVGDAQGFTINDDIRLVNPNNGTGPVKITNVAPGEADTDAVNMSQLKQKVAAATTEVTGTGAAEVTKVTGADGQNIYNVHVDKLMTVKPVDANTKIARGGDGKYYNADDIAGKIFVPSENKWYNTADIDENTGKPLTGKTPLDNQPIAVDQNKLKNSVVNPNGDGPTVLDNVKSGIGGEVKDAAGNNTFIDNINKVVKKSDDGTAAPDAISENTVVNAKDLKNLVYTGFKLNTSGHSGDAQTVKIGDTIQVVDGKNTTVSAITNPATGVHEFHIDVTGLPVTYTAKEGENGQPVDVSKVGDTYQLAGGTKLVKYGDKFYKPNQIVNGQPVGDAQGFTINDDIRLVNPNNGTGPVKITNVAPGEADTDAVNMSQLKQKVAAATTEVTGTGAAEVTKESVDDNGRPTYKVHVDKLVEAKADDGKAIVRGEDNKFYYKDERLKQGKDGKWYLKDELDDDGNPKAGAVGKNIPILGTDSVPAKSLKTSLVNPNDPNSKVKLDNIKSAIGGDVGNGAGSEDKVNGADGTNSFIDNLDKVGKDAAVTTGDLKNLADTPLFFGGDSADGESTDGKEHTNTFDRKLGKQINIKGEVDLDLDNDATAEDRKKAIADKLTDHNIGVISNGKDTLTVKLSKDLKDLNTIEVNDSVSVGKDGDSTVIKGDSLTASSKDENGHDKVTNISSDGFNSTAITFERDGNGQIVRNPDTGLPKEVTNSTNINSDGFTATRTDSEGNEVLKTTMQNGNIAIEKPQPIIDPTTGEAYKVLDKDGNWVPAHGYTKISDNGFEIQGINQSGTGISKVRLSSEGLDNGGNRITHVAEGIAPDDAVNVSQLRGLTQNINNDIANVGANAAALAGLKAIQYDPLEPTQIMAAVGTYRGKQAAALGIAHYKNEDTMFHMGVSIGSDHTMANVGVTYKFGRTDEKKAVPDRYKAGPISSTYVLQDEMVALKEENARMRANDEKMNAAYDEILDLVKQLKQDNEEMKKKLEKLEKK